ncbi:CS1 type fimbrial major subunit [Pseudomonas sp. zbq_11]|uniref:CS1 type fimbrial major subunit n=1 Tax=unclassified Pseudomonas TaxID=196821 RepID=UPI00370B633C
MKSYVLAVPFLALFAGAAVASAPEPITQSISVTAIIPGNDFSVAPVWDWLEKGVTLEYEQEREDFKAVSEKFSAQSDVGAIQAHLLHTASLQDPQTDQKIDLIITVGDKKLELTPAEVMSAEDAKAGNDLPITFKAIKPDNGYLKGEYAGTVSVLFETSSTSL